MDKFNLTFLLVVLLIAGCSDNPMATLDADFELPPPSQSLDPNDIAIGDYIATPCGQNEELLERTERVLVDIFFGRSSQANPLRRPRKDDIRAVEAHGATVYHVFNVPAVRARISLDQIPALMEETFWATVRDVADPRRYDVKLGVGYKDEVTDEDIEHFESLGGRVDTRLKTMPAIFGALPDRSIPTLWNTADLRWLEADGVFCLNI